MLAKVPVKRGDGKSSFGRLTDYVTKNAAAIFYSQNVCSPLTAAGEMASVALKNERVKDPVYHYVLSWREGESPSNQQALDSMVATLTAINLQNHQWIGAVHRNTGHVHVHLAVNRVNPDTFKTVYPKGDWIALDRACRELELKHGWRHSPGPHRVELAADKATHVVRTTRALSDEQRQSLTTKARDFTAWTRLESFQTWVGQQPAMDLKHALEKPNVTWRAVHLSLASFNLEYRKAGSGAIIVDRDQPEKFRAKASHMGRFASLGRLETRLGNYEPLPEKEAHHNRTPARSPKSRNPSYHQYTAGRALRRQQREAEREALRERYVAARSEWDRAHKAEVDAAWERQSASEKTRFEKLRADNREVRVRIRSSANNGSKRTLYSVQAYVAARKREELRLAIRDEHEELKVKLNRGRPGNWREWLAVQAAASDEAAVRALRGIRYRERREELREHGQGVIRASETPRKALLVTLRWTADTRGVNYVRGNVAVFRDEGQRVIFSDTSDETIRSGLMLCREKWSRELYVSGTREFKSKVCALAAEMKICVIDSDVKRQIGEKPISQTVPTDGNELVAPQVDVERVGRLCNKPPVRSDPRLGKQHTGKLVAAGSDIEGRGIVLIDIGRELAVIRTTVETSVDLSKKIGRDIRARSAALEWRFADLQRAGPDLKRDK